MDYFPCLKTCHTFTFSYPPEEDPFRGPRFVQAHKEARWALG